MKAYDPAATCAKCGETGAETRFEPEHVRRTYGSNQMLVGEVTMPDSLRRECQRCGFTWNELPLDAPRDAAEVSR